MTPRLCILTGAPGAGKSTLLDILVGFPFATVDFDELLEPDGTLLGIDIASPTAEPVWPAYNRMWARLAALLLRGGGPVLVMCPLTPDEWTEAATGVPGLPDPEWARLDCADTDRRARLAARPWGSEEIEEALADAEELRGLVPRAFTTSGRGTAEAAEAVARWVRGEDGSDRDGGR
ncbi:hypothetical protein [Streptomyces sp. NPDC088789]|uniref:hypothetical protein n=1 Tax=Streptomyces sp. NPDC088789 TaxID=3365899 RepID=UPI0037FA7FBC